jgi:hypothetical protein
MKKITKAVLAAAAGLMVVTGCSTDADVASQNISQDADNFKVNRRIVGVNGITDAYLFEVQGWCNIHVDKEAKQLEITCKLPDGFKKHFIGLSDNTTYFVEQVDSAQVSTSHYKVTFKPSVIVPDVEAR